MVKDYTQIQITKETRQFLKSFKLVERESYDGVINRALKKMLNNGGK